MSDEEPRCDLCGLPVEIPDFQLRTDEEVKHFCCEGCLRVYRLLRGAKAGDGSELRDGSG